MLYVATQLTVKPENKIYNKHLTKSVNTALIFKEKQNATAGLH